MMRRTAAYWSIACAFVVVFAAGATPGCNCADTGGAGDLGGGNGDGFGSGDGFNGNGDGGVPWCGNDPTCTVDCSGPTCTPPGMFPLPSEDPNVGADGVGRDPNTGYIVLDSSKASFDFLWIANDQNWNVGTVSKISTKPRSTPYPSKSPYPDGRLYGEVARYASVTCFSLTTGAKEGARIGTSPSSPLCADGLHGCCSGGESHPRTVGGAVVGPHTAINMVQNRPSRTAVDFNGDVWVANRAHYPMRRQGSVTKIANNIADCIDRNGDGVIQTSSDVNQDGLIQTDCNGDNLPDDRETVCPPSQPKEFWGLDDECILFTTNIGNGSTEHTIRPLALGPSGTAIDPTFAPSDAWVGAYNTGRFFRVDGTTGQVTDTVQVGPIDAINSNPYGAAIDKYGILWAPNLSDRTTGRNLFYFNTKNTAQQGRVSPPDPTGGTGGFYGIAIDGYQENGVDIQQIWMGEYGGSGAYRYRPVRNGNFAALATGSWAHAGSMAGTANGRGIGVDNRQPVSYVWVAIDGGRIGRIPFNIPDGENAGAVTLFVTGAGAAGNQSGTLGAGVALDLDIWGINQSGSGGIAGGGAGSVTHLRVDAMGNVLNANNPDVLPLDDRPGVAGGKPLPYTYSDFTGFGLRNFTNPRGSYSDIVMSCAPDRGKFLAVEWDAEEPPGTKIQMRARSAATIQDLRTAPWTGLYQTSPADLSMAPGPLAPNPAGFVQVEFILQTTVRDATPKLKSFRVIHICQSIIG
jgi:hypothetical protein